MFDNFRNRTGVKVITIDKLGGKSVSSVHDVGAGCFIYSFFGNEPLYMNKDFTFHDNEIDRPSSVNGDYVLWRPHIGDLGILDWANEGVSDE